MPGVDVRIRLVISNPQTERDRYALTCHDYDNGRRHFSLETYNDHSPIRGDRIGFHAPRHPACRMLIIISAVPFGECGICDGFSAQVDKISPAVTIQNPSPILFRPRLHHVLD